MLGRGIFERRSFSHFMKQAEHRGVAVEVGSHVGSWTLGLSKLFHRVIGFEPHPDNRRYLEENIQRAGAANIKVYPYAVADKLENKFHMSSLGDTRNSGMAHLVPTTPANDNVPSVRTVRLDDVLSCDLSCGDKIGALKIDVEGFELEVLKSAACMVAEHRPAILLEINRHAARYGSSKEQILDHMSDVGYHQADRIRNDYIFVPN